MGLLLFVIALFFLQCICSGQDFAGSGSTDCNETVNCTEVFSCIKTYHDLDLYVRSNTKVIESLTNVFFVTGKKPSKFVRLTYKFQVSYGNNNQSTDEENDVVSCYNHQSKYIWSAHYLYLLGPRALLWSTLFAVAVAENETTIELPCLCHDVYGNLLSRLTYMSKVYAALEYHDQPLNFINNHFLQIKERSVGEYQNITLLMLLPPQFYLFGMPFVAYITNQYIYPEISFFMKRYAEYLSIQSLCDGEGSLSQAIFYISPAIFSIIFKVLLIIGQITSSVEFFTYATEILHDGDFYLPYLHVICSSLAIVMLFAIAIQNLCNKGHDFNSRYALILSLDVIFIIGYFSPFMLLAFIHDPLVTTLTYFVVLGFIAFFIWCFFLLAKYSERIQLQGELSKFQRYILYVVVISAIYVLVLLVMYTSITSALGSFDDFQSLQTLLLSLLVGLVSFYVVKPTYKQVCKHANLITNAPNEERNTEQDINSNSHTNDGSTENIQTNNDHMSNNETEEVILNNQNDEDAIV